LPTCPGRIITTQILLLSRCSVHDTCLNADGKVSCATCHEPAKGFTDHLLVSKGFKRARNKTNIEWKGTPASFNEIRSLAGRLYKEQGIDPQALLGHKDAATTAIYLDNRKVEWVSVG